MKYFSIFSGIGGFELGIQNAFSERHSSDTQSDKHPFQSESCVGFSEIDKYATQIYKKHFPTHKEYGNVSNIKWSDVPDFELLCGGFPCQAFSIAGKRKGFEDSRGTLFFEIIRCLKEKQPKYLLLENVKGLLSHKTQVTKDFILDGMTFECRGAIWIDKFTPIKDWQILIDNLAIFLKKTDGGNGLQKKLKYLNNQILQILKNADYLNIEPLQVLEYNVGDWVSLLKQLSLIENLSVRDIPLLERMVVISGNAEMLLKKKLEENLKQQKLSTTSTLTQQMIDLQTCISAIQEQTIIGFIEKQRLLSNNFWEKILLNSKKEGIYYAKTFNIIIHQLTELGYDLQWQVLNSKNFGVPQNRERVFIVGHLRGTRRPEVFPLLRSDSNLVSRDTKTAKQFANTITGKYGTGNARGTHITTMIPYGTSQDQKISQNISQSLNAGHFNQPKIRAGCRIRRLTPTEAERLQGFKDGWTEGISDTQRYKCLGNAVTSNVITAIMSKII